MEVKLNVKCTTTLKADVIVATCSGTEEKPIPEVPYFFIVVLTTRTLLLLKYPWSLAYPPPLIGTNSRLFLSNYFLTIDSYFNLLLEKALME